jgi:hypothetical protein
LAKKLQINQKPSDQCYDYDQKMPILTQNAAVCAQKIKNITNPPPKKKVVKIAYLKVIMNNIDPR